MIFDKAIGLAIKKNRVKLGYSQEEFANLCEMEVNEIISLEQGLIDPLLSDYITLATQLNMTIVELTKEVMDFKNMEE
jgi:transcriptional regulator with XRE-family HTH domain